MERTPVIISLQRTDTGTQQAPAPAQNGEERGGWTPGSKVHTRWVLHTATRVSRRSERVHIRQATAHATIESTASIYTKHRQLFIMRHTQVLYTRPISMH